MIINETFVDIDDVLTSIIDSDFVDDFTIAGDFNDMKVVLKKILSEEGKLPAFIELEDSLVNNYDKEFLISASRKDDGVYCEKACIDGKYIDCFDDFIFILPSCTKEFIDHTTNFDDEIAYFIVSYPDDEELGNKIDADNAFDIIECSDDDNNIGFIIKYGDDEYYLDIKNVITEFFGIEF